MSESEHRMIEILRILNQHDNAIGAKIISEELKDKGYNLGERAVRYHMQVLDEKGFTEKVGYSGRVITDIGRDKLEKGLIYDQVDFTFSKFEEKIYQTSLSYQTKAGTVIVNTSNILDADAINPIKEVFRSGICVSPLVKKEKIKIKGKDAYRLKTLCGTTIDGILLNSGIPSIPQYGGLVNIEDYTPTKFSELISYKKTSITPLDAFIAKDMTSVLDVVREGNGEIPANFRIIPSASIEKVKEIIKKLKEIGINGVLALGEEGKRLLGVPVPDGMCGLAIIGGVTPFCAAQELDYNVEIKTGEEFIEFKELKAIEKPQSKLKEVSSKKHKKTPFVNSKSWNLIHNTSYDYKTKEGDIVANISYLDKQNADLALDMIKESYKKLPKYINPHYKLLEHPNDNKKIGIATVCSLSIDGILINNGIMSTPQYGGLLELGKPPLFIEMISYNGSSIDPHKIFIFKNLCNINQKAHPKKLLASIKEIPYIARSESEEILKEINNDGIPIYKIGKPRELIYNAKVDNYNFGIVAGSGLNSIYTIKEAGIEIEVKASERNYPLELMDLIYEA